MIMALDNLGQVYACFTQVNTNSKIMGLYLRELVTILDKEDKNWRSNTILMHDGARYSQSNNTEKILRDLRVPFLYLAPHSYNVAPIEMLFGGI